MKSQTDRRPKWQLPRARLSHIFVDIADNVSLPQLVDIASIFRISIVLMMAISCSIYPERLLAVAGDDDLVTFPLRLMRDLPQPFALPNTFCERFLVRRASNDAHVNGEEYLSSLNYYPSTVWYFLLRPFTRWDAARFLKIAHEPLIRYPQRQLCYHRLHDNPTSSNSTTSYTTTTGMCPDVDRILQESEQAHAFLPLFPFLIQCIATLILFCTPKAILPPTCESLLVLSSFILNTFCFLWSAKQLYHMTKLLLDQTNLRPNDDVQNMNTSKRNQLSTSSTVPANSSSELWARRVMLLYIINPASIFFHTAYSESLGAALIFTGYHWMLQYQVSSRKSIHLLITTWVMWYSACFVRSNGTLNAGFLLLYGIGGILSYRFQSMFATFLSASLIFGSIVLVVASLGWHNYSAYRNHCVIESYVFDEESSLASSDLADCTLMYSARKPAWCMEGAYFNVYSYVQSKYWNVAFLRYYELKQFPNFLLATPVLYLSVYAVATWITISWHEYAAASQKFHIPFLYSKIDWAIRALQHFVAVDRSCIESVALRRTEQSTMEMTLLGDPRLLGHYAVLAASTILCLTMAHVQISTRMILSTCPAIYWFVIVKICQHGPLGNAILSWSLLYILLGVTMHPNWLPWT
jgi:GPI mannosyltransferase 2